MHSNIIATKCNRSPILIIWKKAWENMEYSKNFPNSWDHEPFSLSAVLIILGKHFWVLLRGHLLWDLLRGHLLSEHRTLVAFFWDLLRGHLLISWWWMACRRTNYPHDQLSVKWDVSTRSLQIYNRRGTFQKIIVGLDMYCSSHAVSWGFSTCYLNLDT
jgi:hypothetical protein